MLNSVLVTTAHVLINLVIASLAGYGLAKFRFRGRGIVFITILTMTLLPLQVIMIPLFLIVNGLGWFDTYQGLILPTAASAFAVFLMRQFIMTIPTTTSMQRASTEPGNWRCSAMQCSHNWGQRSSRSGF